MNSPELYKKYNLKKSFWLLCVDPETSASIVKLACATEMSFLAKRIIINSLLFLFVLFLLLSVLNLFIYNCNNGMELLIISQRTNSGAMLFKLAEPFF